MVTERATSRTRRGARATQVAPIPVPEGEPAKPVDLGQFTPQVLALAAKCQYRQAHAHHVAHLAGHLFEALAPLHLLPATAATLLHHGALLHDIGYFVAAERHHKHGAYLVKHDVLLQRYPGTARTMLALLVRNHRKQVKEPEQLLPAKKAEVTWKLSALLNVAEALDHVHEGRAVITDVAIDRVAITLHVTGVDVPALQPVLRKRAAVLRKVFDRELRLVDAGQPEKEE